MELGNHDGESSAVLQKKKAHKSLFSTSWCSHIQAENKDGMSSSSQVHRATLHLTLTSCSPSWVINTQTPLSMYY